MLISTCKKQKESQFIWILSAFYCLYEEIIRSTYPFRIPSGLEALTPLILHQERGRSVRIRLDGSG